MNAGVYTAIFFPSLHQTEINMSSGIKVETSQNLTDEERDQFTL